MATSVDQIKLINGKLPNHSEGYPMYYIDRCNNCLCSECATGSLSDEVEKYKPIIGEINWESEIYCDQCSDQIESAYDIAS